MFDQIAIFLFEGPHLSHPLFDLPEGPLKIRGHLIERIGQFLDFVAGLEFEPCSSRPLPISCTPPCSNWIGRAIRRAAKRPVPHSTARTAESIEQHFRDKIGQWGKRFLRILTDHGHPVLAADAAGSQRLTEPHRREAEQGILAAVRIVCRHGPAGLERRQHVDQSGFTECSSGARIGQMTGVPSVVNSIA